MQKLSIAEAQSRLPQLIESLAEGEEVVLTSHGKAVARLVHQEENRQSGKAAKVAELEAFFAPYRKDLADFKFDREEANAR